MVDSVFLLLRFPGRHLDQAPPGPRYAGELLLEGPPQHLWTRPRAPHLHGPEAEGQRRPRTGCGSSSCRPVGDSQGGWFSARSLDWRVEKVEWGGPAGALAAGCVCVCLIDFIFLEELDLRKN